MKTIEELKNEGLMSIHLYRVLLRGIGSDSRFWSRGKYRWEVEVANGNELTVKDVFDIWTEKELLRWKGMGQKTFNELKGLI